MGFQIFVKTDCSTFSIDVGPHDTVQMVKEQIRDLKSIPCEKQQLRIYLMGKILEDTRILSDYNIGKQSIIHLSLKNSISPNKLYVKTVTTGKIIQLNRVDFRGNVSQIKMMIQEMEGIPQEMQTLIFAGERLKNDRMLSHYNIRNESTLHFLFDVILYRKLTIKTTTGKSFTIYSKSSDTIKKIQKDIAKKEGISITNQVLGFKGNVLKDQLSLHDYNIKSNDTLDLFIVVQLSIKMCDGKTVDICAYENAYIKKIKLELRMLENIPISRQLRLQFNAIELHDHQTLYDYNIVDGTVLQLTVIPAADIPNKQIKICLATNQVKVAIIVTLSESIKQFKSKVQKKINVMPVQQILLCNDCVLNPEYTFYDYGITTDSVVYLVVNGSMSTPLAEWPLAWGYQPAEEELLIVYDYETNKQIEDAYAAGKTLVHLNKGPFFGAEKNDMYVVKFDLLIKIVQENTMTGEIIEITRDPCITGTDRYKKFDQSRLTKLRKEYEGIYWLWNKDGQWNQYDEETIYQIEEAYVLGEQFVILNVGYYFGGKYPNLFQISFKSFIEENIETKCQRKIKRTKQVMCPKTENKYDEKTDNYNDNFCLKHAAVILKQIFPEIPSVYYDTNGDMCYCMNCHRKRGDSIIYTRGEPKSDYALPLNWVRLGLITNPGFCKMNNVWDKWHVAFHGTNKDKIIPIFKSGLTLLKPGDLSIDGSKLSIQSGHIKKQFKRYNENTKKIEIFDPLQIFMSPSIKYASHGAYSRWFECNDPDNNNQIIQVQIAFQVRIRPGSYGIGEETVNYDENIILDKNFENHELEWYTKDSLGIVIHGILLHIKQVHKH
eukprot:188197_1